MGKGVPFVLQALDAAVPDYVPNGATVAKVGQLLLEFLGREPVPAGERLADPEDVLAIDVQVLAFGLEFHHPATSKPARVYRLLAGFERLLEMGVR